MKALLILSLLAASFLGGRVLAHDMTKLETIVGIGATLNKLADGSIEVTGSIPGAPAERAGLGVGDLITAVQSAPTAPLIDTRALPLADVVGLIRGPEGSTVRLKIERGTDAPFTLTILREKFEIEDEI